MRIRRKGWWLTAAVAMIYVGLGLSARNAPKPAVEPSHQTTTYAGRIVVPGDGTYDVVVKDRPGVTDLSLTSEDGRFLELAATDLGGDGKGIWDKWEACMQATPFVLCEDSYGSKILNTEDYAFVQKILRETRKEKNLTRKGP